MGLLTRVVGWPRDLVQYVMFKIRQRRAMRDAKRDDGYNYPLW